MDGDTEPVERAGSAAVDGTTDPGTTTDERADGPPADDLSGGRRGRASRRGFLALCASAAAGATAGCNAAVPEETATAGPTDEPDAADATAGTTATATDGPTGGSDAGFADLYRSVVDSVTLVETSTGSGSGWVVDDAGRVVTNQHVVETDASVDVRYDSDEWRTAEVLGTDGIGDLAVVEPTAPPEYGTALPLADETPAVGSDVAIVGAPFGLPGSLSVGVVSATNRFLDSPTGSSIPGAIQVDATANPGNSGGPIFAPDGSVVGVLNSGEGVAVNFGIPARLVERVVPALVESGRYRYPTLGASVLEVDPMVARANDLDAVTGVLVTDVTRGGPAAGRLRASDRATAVNGVSVPVGGDVIVGVGDRTITSDEGYASYLTYETDPGDEVDVAFLRDGSRQTTTLTVGTRSRS